MAYVIENKLLTLKLNNNELDKLNDALQCDGLLQDGDYINKDDLNEADFILLFNINLIKEGINYDEIDTILISN